MIHFISCKCQENIATLQYFLKLLYCSIAIVFDNIIAMKNEKEFLEEFSKSIKKLRKLKKYKMEDFSFKSEIDYTTLYRTEQGQNIYIYTAYKILKNLDIDLLEIIDKKIEEQNLLKNDSSPRNIR